MLPSKYTYTQDTPSNFHASWLLFCFFLNFKTFFVSAFDTMNLVDRIGVYLCPFISACLFLILYIIVAIISSPVDDLHLIGIT
ncbi:hypothetical protein P170DRAFT_14891 [Aspergillus steynii IBT 23096]|uniref:Uncharacterized protein n=1 Tax=Aspergillus steynii IBT 23096 TaxID=1392250 RepID=A0A2I2GNB9_9EURO|nr:uncharacterized protein P170DRAFT_14891 [Aspergillus steynii IBT 23096]PLB54349.1 hypothetical protein P170DRAFT_14891 [Aspergillus steynii IBT 23096]